MACATTRAFAKVKSSAMMPRQPSVPNLISVIRCWGKYTRSNRSANGRIGLLEEVFPPLLFEPFHDFADVLGAIARADEKGIGGFNHNEVTHANRGHKFRRAPQKIAFGVERVSLSCQAIFTFLLCQQFINGGPRADVAPAHFGGNHKHARRASDASRGLKDRVVHGNIFELGVERAQLTLVVARSDVFS